MPSIFLEGRTCLIFVTGVRNEIEVLTELFFCGVLWVIFCKCTCILFVRREDKMFVVFILMFNVILFLLQLNLFWYFHNYLFLSVCWECPFNLKPKDLNGYFFVFFFSSACTISISLQISSSKLLLRLPLLPKKFCCFEEILHSCMIIKTVYQCLKTSAHRKQSRATQNESKQYLYKLWRQLKFN